MRRRARKAWDKLGLFGQIGVVVLGLALAALAYVFVVKWLPEWLANDDLTGNDRAEDEGRNRTAVLATIAGMIAVVGAFFTGLSYRLNRAGQITERFTRAIDQLGATDESGKPKVDVALGGIYALERIAGDSKEDHPQVVEVLTAYVREHARYQPDNRQAPTTSSEQGQDDDETSPDHVGAPPLATNVQAAMDVLARRDVTQDRPSTRLHLAGTDLRRLELDARDGAHLEEANLRQAHLEEAYLDEAHLERASLREAHLDGAVLREAHLEDADLAQAHLDWAVLEEAHLERANLGLAHLEYANLGQAHLEEAYLDEAHLVWAILDGAHLKGANLDRANLEGASLDGAHLEGATLDGARLLKANLEGAILDGAVYDHRTVWPTPEFESEARARGAIARPRG